MPQNVKVPPFTEAPSTVVGGTPQSTFEFDFPFFATADIIVLIDGVELDPNDYTVTGYYLQDGQPVEGGYGSGQVVLDAPVANVTVTLDRLVAGDRESQFSRSAPLGMPALNGDLNRLTARQQDLARRMAVMRAELDGFAGDVAYVDAQRAAVQAIFDVAGEVQSGASVTYLPAGEDALAVSVQTYLRRLPIYLEDFGAVPDNWTDSTEAIQKAVDLAIATGRRLHIRQSATGASSLFVASAPITISGPIHITGDGKGYCGIVFEGSSGFEIDAGVNFVTMERFGLFQRVRYTTTPNAYVAIKTLGVIDNRNFYHVYEDLFFDGWYMMFDVSYFWAANINRCQGAFGSRAIMGRGESVNVCVTHNQFAGCSESGSIGVQVGDGLVATEGWWITDNLFCYYGTGVKGLGAGNCHVRGNIIDFNQTYGVYLESNEIVGSIDWTIDGNYIATDNAAGAVAVRLTNTFAGSAAANRGHSVTSNQILYYVGAAWSYGIAQDGTEELVNVIIGNKVKASVYACRVFTGAGTIVTGNSWVGGVFRADVAVKYEANTGSVEYTTSLPNPAGSFTPVVFGTSTAGSATYSIQKGVYNLADGVCHFTLYVTYTGHTGTGALRISGLPFTVKSELFYEPVCAVSVEDLTFPASTTMVQAFCVTNETNVELRATGSGIAPTAVAMDAAATIKVSGSYRIN